MPIIKIGNVELTETEAQKFHHEQKYIVAFRRIFSVDYSVNGGYHGREIYYHRGDLPLTKRGRFCTKTATEINKMLGHELLNA